MLLFHLSNVTLEKLDSITESKENRDLIEQVKVEWIRCMYRIVQSCSDLLHSFEGFYTTILEYIVKQMEKYSVRRWKMEGLIYN